MTRPGNAQYLRELRAAAVAAGKCLQCRLRPARPGLKTCLVCAVRRRLREERYASAGLCKCGRKPRSGFKRCVKCRRQASASHKRVRRRRLAVGQCAWHGRCCEAPAMPGRRMCGVHLALSSLMQIDRYARDRSVGVGP